MIHHLSKANKHMVKEVEKRFYSLTSLNKRLSFVNLFYFFISFINKSNKQAKYSLSNAFKLAQRMLKWHKLLSIITSINDRTSNSKLTSLKKTVLINIYLPSPGHIALPGIYMYVLCVVHTCVRVCLRASVCMLGSVCVWTELFICLWL